MKGLPGNADRIFSREEVESALDAVAARLNEDLSGSRAVLIAVMTGGMVPAGQLITRLTFDLELDYLHATRYRGGLRGGDLEWLYRPRTSLRDRDVVLVDDILDEGHTLAAAMEHCRAQGARSVRTVVLVEKLHDRRRKEIQADYVGLQVPDRYVFGYGMDYRERLRNLPGIYALQADHDE